MVDNPVTQTDEVDINTQSKKFVKFRFLDEKGKNKRNDPTVIIRKKPKVKTAGGFVSSLSFNCLIKSFNITSNKNPTLPRCFASGGCPGTLLLRNNNSTLPRCFASGGYPGTLLLRNNNPTLPRCFASGGYPGTLLLRNKKSLQL